MSFWFDIPGPDRVDRRHHRVGHHPVHRHLHHLRRLHQEEEESREEILRHGQFPGVIKKFLCQNTVGNIAANGLRFSR